MLLVGKPEGKRPLGRPSCRWECNFKKNLTETGWDSSDSGFLTSGMNWLHLEQRRMRCTETPVQPNLLPVQAIMINRWVRHSLI
jgi:hypothetical protein